MNLTEIDHIGIVTDDADETMAFYEANGMTKVYDTDNDDYNTRVVFLETVPGALYFELLEPYGEGMVRDMLTDHGPGYEHIAYRVYDIHAAVEDLRADGVEFQSEEPRPGAGDSLVIYIAESDTAGLSMELVEPQPGDPRYVD
jgi:methylmalonyl-CoA/ethylmalonyl-CoA epimerase